MCGKRASEGPLRGSFCYPLKVFLRIRNVPPTTMMNKATENKKAKIACKIWKRIRTHATKMSIPKMASKNCSHTLMCMWILVHGLQFFRRRALRARPVAVIHIQPRVLSGGILVTCFECSPNSWKFASCLNSKYFIRRTLVSCLANSPIVK